MNDLIRRSALIEELQKGTIISDDLYGMGIMSGVDFATKRIAAAPAVDAVPVVRCAQCKRRYDADECPMCFLVDGEYHEYTNGNGYCDRGERRNGDATD